METSERQMFSVADQVRRHVAGAVAHEVAQRERRNELIREQLEVVLRGPLRERLRENHDNVIGDPKRRREALAEVARGAAEAAHGELVRWMRSHIGNVIEDDLGTVLRDRLDEALHGPALCSELGALDGQRGDLLLLTREHLVGRLREHLADDAGCAVAERIEPKVKDAVRARLCEIFDDAGFERRLEELARSDSEPWATAVASLAANFGRNALDRPLEETVRQYLDEMFRGRAQLFRDEIGKLIARDGAAAAPEWPGRGAELGEAACTAEAGIGRLVRERIDDAMRDRLTPQLRQRLHDALAMAVSPAELGVDLGLDSSDLDRITDVIWDRWGFALRERIGHAIGERVTALVGRRVGEAVRAALSPGLLELAAMTRAPAPRPASRPATRPSTSLSVF